MSADDLSKSLTPDRSSTNSQTERSWVRFTAAALISLGLGLLGWMLLQNNPLGGQPFVVVSLENRSAAEFNNAANENVPADIRQTIAPGDADQPEVSNVAVAPNVSTIQRGGDIAFDQESDDQALNEQGNISNSGNQPIIHGGNGRVRLSSAADQNLIEQTRSGSLPKIGPQGQRASVVYARPSGINSTNAESPHIAILVTGLGIGASGTSDAIQTLPGPVTLAFAPYGKDLQRWIGKARGYGHEVMLQIPMEPFDYPDNDPGPHTLLTNTDTDENLHRLRWLLSRFTGYIGVTNYMGARFTAMQSVFEPVLREISDRGLVYLDDGSSPRSTHEQISAAISLQSSSADVLIDAQQSQERIDEALQQLEILAYQRGQVVGVASALPLSVSRITEWAAGLEEKGIILVPVSAVYRQPEQS